LGFWKAVAKVRPMCAGWHAVHDAAVVRLVFNDILDRGRAPAGAALPAVASVQFKWILHPGHYVTDAGVVTVWGCCVH
jgi:hypothetical protein